MADKHRLTRRGWIRSAAGAPPQRTLGRARMNEIDNGPLPTAGAETEPGRLPPVHESWLDANEVSALLTDIGRHATHLHWVGPKRIANSADPFAVLATLGRQLFSGELTRVQLRYQWQDQDWIDTLDARQDRFRLVRIGFTRTRPA